MYVNVWQVSDQFGWDSAEAMGSPLSCGVSAGVVAVDRCRRVVREMKS